MSHQSHFNQMNNTSIEGAPNTASTFQGMHMTVGNTAMPLTVDKRFAIISRHTAAGGRFLDCGCGLGNYVRLLCERLHLDAYGVEFEQEAVESAWSDEPLKRRVSQGDLHALQYPDDSWDYAMLNEVLEHVADDQKVLFEVHRILKPGGLLFVFSPNRWFPFETHGVSLRIVKRRVYCLPFTPYMPVKWGKYFYTSWARNYWQGQMKKLIENAGFAVVERDFIWPTFENISGRQPKIFKFFRSLFRGVANAAEKMIFVRRFGVSQAWVCRKAPFFQRR